MCHHLVLPMALILPSQETDRPFWSFRLHATWWPLQLEHEPSSADMLHSRKIYIQYPDAPYVPYVPIGVVSGANGAAYMAVPWTGSA